MRDVSCTHYKQFSITPLSSSKILRTMLLSFQFQFLVNLKQKVFYWNIEISNWIFRYFCFANWSELSFQQHTHGLVPYSPTSNTDDISITRRSLLRSSTIEQPLYFTNSSLRKKVGLLYQKSKESIMGTTKVKMKSYWSCWNELEDASSSCKELVECGCKKSYKVCCKYHKISNIQNYMLVLCAVLFFDNFFTWLDVNAEWFCYKFLLITYIQLISQPVLL